MMMLLGWLDSLRQLDLAEFAQDYGARPIVLPPRKLPDGVIDFFEARRRIRPRRR